ncbi:sugar dehydrogenase complex small subunit [Histidinibacterium aquaticum]|uniref:Gluconate 2-dehydrogenase subunit 3 family protein n=1 Tax=Histidinibacterium aquaticum TaxID=2613962 RepID=A0A5J5GMU6_9RHOB|nr:sugar dehydrogenase complex small subunit [Histidinibacterium aquaticum]KAA9008854.1 hypothetical protein F3S47_06210 [Histidinibacterium aquaticum]
MTSRLTRRQALGTLGSTALTAVSGTAWAQDDAVQRLPRTALGDTLARLSGVNPLPQDMLRRLYDATGGDVLPADADEIGDGLEKRLLKALYSGVLAPAADEGGSGTRIGFSEALMWHAVEDYKNVISFCGGVPGFWASPPET